MELKVKYDLPIHAEYRNGYMDTGIDVVYPLSDSDCVDFLRKLMIDNGFSPVEIDLKTDKNEIHWESDNGYWIKEREFQEVAEIIDEMSDSEIEALFAYKELLYDNPEQLFEKLIEENYIPLRKIADNRKELTRNRDEIIEEFFRDNGEVLYPDYIKDVLKKNKEFFWENFLQRYVMEASNGIWIKE